MTRTFIAVRLSAAAFLAALLLPVAAPAAVVPMDVPALATTAHSIVEVRVTDEQARRGKPGGAGIERAGILSDTAMRVTGVLKGSKPVEITITQPGGTVGDDTLLVPELPAFSAGERCLVFLNESGGVVGGYQGKLDIVDGDVPVLGMKLAQARRYIKGLAEGTITAASLPDAEPPAPAAVVIRGAWAALASESAFQTVAVVYPVSSAVSASAVGPVITGITPSGRNAGVRETVTITGAGFGSTRGSGRVGFIHGSYMNGTRVLATNYVSWSDTRIVCEVPRNAASGRVVVIDSAGVGSAGFSYTVGFSASGLKTGTQPLVYRINENCPDLTGEGAAIQRAMTTWSEAGSNFRLAYGGRSTASANPPRISDGSNDIYFSRTGFTDSGFLGWNFYWFSGSTITESDIILNDNHNWADGAVSGRLDVETVALHEIGHTVGLDDQYGDAHKVMGVTMVGATKRSLSQAERDGVNYLYGAVRDTAPPSTPSVSSSTHPSQETWVSHNAPALAFRASDDVGVTGYAYVLDRHPSTVPAATGKATVTSASFSGLESGEWWFHVRAHDAAGNWSGTRHYRLRVDHTLPSTSHNALKAYANSATITLRPSDVHSGVAGTSWSLDGVTGSGTGVSTTEPGEHTLTFYSVDAAGNREPDQSVTFRVATSAGQQQGDLGVMVAPGKSVTAVVTVDADDSNPVMDLAVLFDEVVESGGLAASRTAMQAPSGWRALGSAVEPVFSGSCTGTITVSVPFEPVLSEKRAAGLRVVHRGEDGELQVLKPAVSTTTNTLSAEIDCLGPILVVEPLSVSPASSVKLRSASKLTPAYGAQAYVSVNLADSFKAPLTGRVVTLHRSDGRVVATLKPGKTPGVYTGYAPLARSRTTFSVRFAGDVAHLASRAKVTVKPKVRLTARTVSTATRGRYFTVSGTMKPAHSRAAVKLEIWKRRSSGSYAKVRTLSTTTSSGKPRRRLALSSGTYRLRWTHADSGHTLSRSAWVKVRVR